MFEFGRANFSDMVAEKEGEVAVTSVAHSAVVKVDESGAEAAAATAAVIGTRTVQINLKDFIVDRPFVFMIHDKKHDVPLFFGRILNPTSTGDFDYQEPTKESSEVQEQSRAEEEVKFAPLQSTTEDKVQTTEDKVQKECLEELGYESVSDPNVSFPCKGRDTIPIEKHNEEDQKMRQEQIEVLLQAKEATSPFQ